jgi:predicted DNA-binding ribbon-helix-helix protein
MAAKMKSARALVSDVLRHRTTLRLPRDLWNQVAHVAIDEGTTVQAIVEKALEKYLAAKGVKS